MNFKKTLAVIGTAGVLAFSAACGGTSTSDTSSASSGEVITQEQQPEPQPLDGYATCATQYGGTVIATEPDDDMATDPTEVNDVICLTADGQIIKLDGNDGDPESNAESYYYLDEDGFLIFYHGGKIKKHGSKKYTLPKGYHAPAPGHYTVPKPGTKPNTGTATTKPPTATTAPKPATSTAPKPATSVAPPAGGTTKAKVYVCTGTGSRRTCKWV